MTGRIAFVAPLVAVVLSTGLSRLAAGESDKRIVVQMSVVEVPAEEGPKSDRRPSAEVRRIVGDAAAIERILEFLRTGSKARTISRPTIVTLPGQEATMQSGGEFQVPVLNRDGTWTSEGRFFGTRISVEPTLEERTIHLVVAAEFSERNFENAVTVNGKSIPGLTTQRFRVEADVPAGQAILLVADYEDGTRLVYLHPEVAGSDDE